LIRVDVHKGGNFPFLILIDQLSLVDLVFVKNIVTVNEDIHGCLLGLDDFESVWRHAFGDKVRLKMRLIGEIGKKIIATSRLLLPGICGQSIGLGVVFAIEKFEKLIEGDAGVFDF